MRIGVISDTHLRGVTKEFKDLVEEYFVSCDYLFHLGDFTSLALYEFLKGFMGGRLAAVCGNMDPLAVRRVLPERQVLEFEGVRIGLAHGWGAPYDLEERLERLFSDEGVHCIAYGHTHNGANHRRGDVLFFNPGSPTDRVFATVNTIGYLEVSEGRISGRLVEVKP